jgi:stage II sporulation protein D
LTKSELEEKMKAKHSDFNINYNNDDAIKILEYTDAGRVKKIKIGNLNLSGIEMRTILGLKSAEFKVEIDEDNIKFEVTGYGHGVGMSQTGADAMAKTGSNYEDIIKHFYTGVEIVNF